MNRDNRVIDLQSKAQDLDCSLLVDKYSKVRDKYETPQFPLVLCHGFLGFDRLDIVPNFSLDKDSSLKSKFYFDYWRGIRVALEELGCNVLIGRVSAFGTIGDRAAMLDAFISKQCNALRNEKNDKNIYNTQNNSQTDGQSRDVGQHQPIKVNLISHSMGGLDCRYLIWKMRNDGRKRNYAIASLTTISTPHHGSECADFLVKYAGSKGFGKKVMPPSVYELTTSKMRDFNAKVTDDPQVHYFSYGARFTPKWFNLFNLSWRIMTKMMSNRTKESRHTANRSLDNDGLVSVDSARWGEYLGTLDAVDHLDLINWTNQMRTTVDKVFFQEEPKFNAIALYLDIADNLAKRRY